MSNPFRFQTIASHSQQDLIIFSAEKYFLAEQLHVQMYNRQYKDSFYAMSTYGNSLCSFSTLIILHFHLSIIVLVE